MPEQRIVLANGSRLLRDMLKKILLKSDRLTVVQEVTDPKELPAVIEHIKPEWVILSLPYENAVPGWVDRFIAAHPSVRFLGMASDGSRITVKWLEMHEQELEGLSLNDFLKLLESRPVSP